MSSVILRGDAPAVADVYTLTVGGTVEADDLFIGTANGKSVSVAAGATAVATVATNFATGWNASSIPEFAEGTAAATSGGALTVTADTLGKPLMAITVSTTEANGGGADAQTFGVSHTTTSQGPNDWSTALNWAGAAVPVSTDTAYLDQPIDMLYGLNQTGVALTALNFHAIYTAKVGLPERNSDGATPYDEGRQKYLKIGSTTTNVGIGSGKGIRRLRLDSDGVATTQNIYTTGKTADAGFPTVMLIGSNASNVLNVMGNSDVGVAFIENETAQYATIRASGKSTLAIGAGCTLATLDQSESANVILACAATTVTKTGTGKLTTQGSGAITTLAVENGTVDYQGTGTIATLTISPGGVFDLSNGVGPVTITNTTCYGGYTLLDPHKRATFTNPISFLHCGPSDGTLDLGSNISLQRS